MTTLIINFRIYIWNLVGKKRCFRFSNSLIMLRYILQNQDPDKISQGSPNESKIILSPESPDRYFFDEGVKIESINHFARQRTTNPMQILHFSLEFTIQSLKVKFFNFFDFFRLSHFFCFVFFKGARAENARRPPANFQNLTANIVPEQ